MSVFISGNARFLVGHFHLFWQVYFRVFWYLQQESTRCG